jgi:7-keto-8-aminopelargonate synthetase-like enzyme
MSDLFQDQLQALRAQSLHRKLREIRKFGSSAKHLANFSSNDYLGLANDTRLRKAAIDAIEEFGVGAGASRLGAMRTSGQAHPRRDRVCFFDGRRSGSFAAIDRLEEAI